MRKPELILKNHERKDDDTLRIYKMTGDAVELFNNYVLDFFESINIIEENISRQKGDSREGREEIDYISKKIADITVDMEKIATEMPELVEIRYREPAG